MPDRFQRQIRVQRRTSVFEGGGKRQSRRVARARLRAADRRSSELQERPCHQCHGDPNWVCGCSDPGCNASCDCCGGIGTE